MLSPEKRKEYMEYLGYEYNAKGIKQLQYKYFTRKQDIDGKYGPDTDKLLRHVRNVKKFTKNFKPEEFKCDCGGRHCTGYPSWMKMTELKNLQTIRDHYNKPMKVTCGLRCKGRNKELQGSIQNSLHLSGYATDFYMQGVTDTLANRKKAVKYFKTLPYFHYAYGNGINSYGSAVSAPYMGNAMHIDSNKAVAKKKSSTKSSTKKADSSTKVVKVQTNADKIVAKAKAFCWPYGTKKSKYKYKTGHATSKYKAALKKYMHKKAKISQTDCGYFVNTCVRAAGISKTFKALPAKASQPYPKLPSTMKIVHNGGKIPKGFLKPGDIIRYKKKNGHQHTLMYYGNGKMASAARGHRFPVIQKDTHQYHAKNVKLKTLQVLRAKER